VSSSTPWDTLNSVCPVGTPCRQTSKVPVMQMTLPIAFTRHVLAALAPSTSDVAPTTFRSLIVVGT